MISRDLFMLYRFMLTGNFEVIEVCEYTWPIDNKIRGVEVRLRHRPSRHPGVVGPKVNIRLEYI